MENPRILMPSSFNLTPMSLGELLRRTLDIYLHSFFHLLAVASLPYLLLTPLGVLNELLTEVNAKPQNGDVKSWPFLVLSILALSIPLALLPLGMGAIIRSASEQYHGRPPGMWICYKHTLPRGIALIWLHLLQMLVAALALAVTAGIFLWHPMSWANTISDTMKLWAFLPAGMTLVCVLRLALAMQVVVIEGTGWPAALKQSRVLMRNNVLRVVVIILLGLTAETAVGFLFEYPMLLFGGKGAGLAVTMLGQVINDIGSVFSAPLIPIASTLLYYDCRVRNSSLNVDQA